MEVTEADAEFVLTISGAALPDDLDHTVRRDLLDDLLRERIHAESAGVEAVLLRAALLGAAGDHSE